MTLGPKGPNTACDTHSKPLSCMAQLPAFFSREACMLSFSPYEVGLTTLPYPIPLASPATSSYQPRHDSYSPVPSSNSPCTSPALSPCRTGYLLTPGLPPIPDSSHPIHLQSRLDQRQRLHACQHPHLQPSSSLPKLQPTCLLVSSFATSQVHPSPSQVPSITCIAATYACMLPNM